MFDNFHNWIDHELQEHRLEWRCQLCLEPPMNSPVQFEVHLRRSHSVEIAESQLSRVMDACKRPKKMMSASSCPFCDDAEAKALSVDPHLERGNFVVPAAVFARHVASHMEQLALFAIPRDTGDSKDDVATNRNANTVSNHKLSEERESMPSSYPEHGQVGKVLDDDEQNETISNASSTDQIEDPLLHKAAFEGRESEVFKLLDLGEDINCQGSTWGSALGAAVIGQHANLAWRLIERGADLFAPCGKYASTVQAATDLPDKALERILFETSVEQERITFITTTRVEMNSKATSMRQVGATFRGLEEHVPGFSVHVPGFFDGLSETCLSIGQQLEDLSQDKYLDNKDAYWLPEMRSICHTFLRTLGHVLAFINLIFDLLEPDSENRIKPDVRQLVCPRLRLIFRFEREMSLISTLGTCSFFRGNFPQLLFM